MNKIKIYEASKIIWDAIKNENNINSLPKRLFPKLKKEAYFGEIGNVKANIS